MTHRAEKQYQQLVALEAEFRRELVRQLRAVSALVMAWAGYMPPEEPTEADGMSWLFRRIGRG